MTDSAPEIVYPCIWVFAVIGSDEAVLRSGIEAVMGQRQYDLQFSRRSTQGNYCSFHLETRVENQTERDQLYRELKRQSGVKMVL